MQRKIRDLKSGSRAAVAGSKGGAFDPFPFLLKMGSTETGAVFIPITPSKLEKSSFLNEFQMEGDGN